MDIALQNEIESLRRLKTRQLQGRFQELFGEKSPSSNRAHLFRRIAWRLQARAEGDLSERARRRAAELAEDVAFAAARSPIVPGRTGCEIVHPGCERGIRGCRRRGPC